MKLFAFCVVLAAAGTLAEKYTCPDYEDIRQPSVDPFYFDMKHMNGKFYLLATTEPTIPSYCDCIREDWTVYEESYKYDSSSSCEALHTDMNFTFHCKGNFKKDSDSPGSLMENAAMWNRTMLPEVPNMIFNVIYGKDHTDIIFAETYACLGTFFGHSFFSYNLLAREQMDLEEIKEMVKASGALAGDRLNLDKVRYTDKKAFAACDLRKQAMAVSLD